MKRILTCLLILVVVGVFDPTSSWADPRRQEYDVPGEGVGAGDDDEPHKTGLQVAVPGVGQSPREAHAVARRQAPVESRMERQVGYLRRFASFVDRLARLRNLLDSKSSR
jgi:hypothetical protein